MDTPIDTLRLLVSWKCNLKCSYCCNEIPRFRQQFRSATLNSLDFNKYSTVCVSGGEPILHIPLLLTVLKSIPTGKTVVLYANGILLTLNIAHALQTFGVQYANIGLHYPKSFDKPIGKILEIGKHTTISYRFHAQDVYREELMKKWPQANFRFWTMDDCDRGNEDRVILVE